MYVYLCICDTDASLAKASLANTRPRGKMIISIKMQSLSTHMKQLANAGLTLSRVMSYVSLTREKRATNVL